MRTISKEGLKVLLDNIPEGYAVDGLGNTLESKNKIKVWLNRQKSDIGYIIKTKEIKTEVILFNYFVVDKDTIIVFNTEENVKGLLSGELPFKVDEFYSEDLGDCICVVPVGEDSFLVERRGHYVGVVYNCVSSEDAVKKIYPDAEITGRYEIYPKDFN